MWPSHPARNARAAPRRDWHSMTVEQALEALRSSRSGLDSPLARRRLEHYGPNALPRGHRVGPLTLLVRHITVPLQLLLLASGLAGFAFDRPIDGTVVVAVVLLNAFIGAFQELRATRAIESLSDLVPDLV